MAMTLETEREAFEKWYVENAFDYEANPLGSRDCGLQWKSWQAARTTQPAPLITDEAVERLAQHIYEQEARNRCKTIDEAVFHRSKWRRAIPEARAMLESTFPAHITQPAQAVDVVYSEGVCGDGAAILRNGEPMRVHGIVAALNATRALSAEDARWPRVCGTSRVADNAKCLLVSFEREPTNNELVAFDDAIKAASPTPDKEW